MELQRARAHEDGARHEDGPPTVRPSLLLRLSPLPRPGGLHGVLRAEGRNIVIHSTTKIRFIFCYQEYELKQRVSEEEKFAKTKSLEMAFVTFR